LERAGDYLDKGGFAGAVFANHRVDFPGLEIKRDVTEGMDRLERFADMGKFEKGYELSAGDLCQQFLRQDLTVHTQDLGATYNSRC
jgi:hypothetical protein